MTKATRFTLALALPLLALAACDSPSAPATGAAGAAAATSAASQGPVRRFDGRYVGALTLNPDRTRACRELPGDKTLTVAGGRASIEVNPQSRLTLRGSVRDDASLTLTDMVDRSIALTGSFTGDRYNGVYRNGFCSYSAALIKRD